MNIHELNAKLVSELREIAKLIGIPDADKLRKQELISKIVETGDQEENLYSCSQAPGHAGQTQKSDTQYHYAQAARKHTTKKYHSYKEAGWLIEQEK